MFFKINSILTQNGTMVIIRLRLIKLPHDLKKADLYMTIQSFN